MRWQGYRFIIAFCCYLFASPSLAETDYKALYQQGRLAEQSGNYDQAIDLYQQALKASREANKARATATLLFWLGGVYQQQLRYAEAETAQQEAIKIRETEFGADSAEVAVALNSLAGLYYELGDYAGAENLYKRALDIERTVYGNEHPKVAIRLNNLGEVRRTLADYDAAELLFKQALDIDRAAYGEQHANIAIRLSNLAEVSRLTGDYAQAEQYLNQALAIDQAAFDKQELTPSSLAIRLNNLAQLHRTIGNYAEAEPLYLKALDLWKQHLGENHPLYATGLNNLGWLYHLQKQYKLAETHYQRALAIVQQHYGKQHPERARHLNNLGLLFIDLERYDEAEPLLNEALQIWQTAYGLEHPAVAATLTNLARLYQARQQYDQAEAALQRALSIVQTLNVPMLYWKILDALSQVLAQQQQFSAAILLGKQTINSLQSLRANVAEMSRELQRHFIHDKADIYRRVADWLLNQGRLSEAQQVLMMLKEEEFFDFVRRDNNNDARTLTASYNDTEQPWVTRSEGLRQQFTNLGGQIQALQHKAQLTEPEKQKLKLLRQQADQTLETLNGYFHDLKQAMKDKETVALDVDTVCLSSVDALQRLNAATVASLNALQTLLRRLGDGAVILHYLVTENKVRIILTTADTQICREVMITRQELDSKINDFREKLQTPQYRIYRDAQAMYTLLFAPIAEDLEFTGAKTLMLSLDGNLRYLPIGALFSGREYVAQQYQLALFTDVAREHIQQHPARDWKLAGLGLTQQIGSFNPLPAVKMELEGIIRQDDADPDGVLPGIVRLNNAFNFSTFQQTLKQAFPVIHIASHFVFNPAGTDQSSFLLLGDGSELTLAQVREQFDFSNLDLLTLSACETAMGSIHKGREIEGLGALAQRQGAKGVIATLWPVNDESTGAFMQHLYQLHAENPNLSKAAAIQQTQVAFITARRAAALARKNPDSSDNTHLYPVYYDHPYYWAPFILMGNWL